MAIQFGKTWWGEQWLNSLSDIDYENRLERGRSYANKGAVKSIKFDNNQIHAKVAGSRSKPYKVDIILPPFFDPELSEFIKKLSLKPIIISKLLNRELDSEVLFIAEEIGLKVFPKKWTDLKMQCSCPDWAVPCKHLASVIYKISSEIDNNPFLVFELHNVNLIDELYKLGIVVSKETTEIPKLKNLYFSKNKSSVIFNPENAYKKLSFSNLKSIHEPLTKLLSDFPVFYQSSGNFKEKYTSKISRHVKNAQKVIQGKILLENLFLKAQIQDQNISRHAHEAVVIDENFNPQVLIDETSFTFVDFLKQIAQIPSNKTIDYQPSTAALHTILQLALHLLAHGAVIPQIMQLPNKNFAIRWLPATLSPDVRYLLEKLSDILPPDTFIWREKSKHKIINNEPALNLLSLFLTELMRIMESEDSQDMYLNLFFRKEEYAFALPGEEALSGGVMQWTQRFFIAQGNYKPQIVVEELVNDDFKVSLSFFDESSKNLLTPISLYDVLNQKKYDSKRFEILQGVSQLSPFINGLDEHINNNASIPIVMNTEIFTTFLMEMIPAIQLLDVAVLLPKSLQEILKPKTSLKIKKTANRSYIGLKDIFDFDWQVALGDNLVSEAEFKKLLSQSKGLLKYKSNYIYVEERELQKIFKHFTEVKELSSLQLLRAAISGEYQGAKVALTDEIQELINELTKDDLVALPKDLNAQLRPYQQRGFSWMYRNAKIGFGSVLADDMGLGKTLQVITTLQKHKEEGLLDKEKTLVVAPTGLLNNWQMEIQKFAPKLKTKIYHGPNRKFEKEDDFDVVISSYGMIRSDVKELKKMKWNTMVIDEAQNIKNINTEQTKAVKAISAKNYIAMSGTPVENRLSEMWSIMDFANKGYLGSIKEFNERFSIPIEQSNDEAVALQLKKTTAPFLIRRLKSDKSIISDLPEKIEMNCFASLVKDQASLYEKTLQKAMEDIEGITATDAKAMFVRRGLILQMIMALKQICNHPTQFLKNKLIDPLLSGKMELLFDKLDSIVESNEKVLIFTQFTQMGNLMHQFINDRYGEAPLFYHGGCSMKQRTEMVENFQQNHADKIFILSLKAAGTGLNLTAANHVIHYDLWWNPAVEAQATDRAYRIGQQKNVMVHRFITKNTFEEKIDAMIQSKKNLADMTVATGENWIGNLSNKELKNIFS